MGRKHGLVEENALEKALQAQEQLKKHLSQFFTLLKQAASKDVRIKSSDLTEMTKGQLSTSPPRDNKFLSKGSKSPKSHKRTGSKVVSQSISSSQRMEDLVIQTLKCINASNFDSDNFASLLREIGMISVYCRLIQ